MWGSKRTKVWQGAHLLSDKSRVTDNWINLLATVISTQSLLVNSHSWFYPASPFLTFFLPKNSLITYSSVRPPLFQPTSLPQTLRGWKIPLLVKTSLWMLLFSSLIRSVVVSMQLSPLKHSPLFTIRNNCTSTILQLESFIYSDLEICRPICYDDDGPSLISLIFLISSVIPLCLVTSPVIRFPKHAVKSLTHLLRGR